MTRVRQVTLVAALLLGFTLAVPVAAQAPAEAEATAPRAPRPPKGFASPEAGFAALADAARAHDARRLRRILGDAGLPLIRSGEPQADRAAQSRFAEAYAARAEILRPMPDRADLVIGSDGFPFPIPMLRRGDTWRFDAAQGRQALIDRRIGHNELAAVAVLRAILAAQQDYAAGAGRQGGMRAYARRLFSSPGQRDGLWWPTAEGEGPSPLGPLVAAASAGGYARRGAGDAPQPYHGYLFRLLEAQGPAAPGGAMDYLVNGRLIGGFAVIATPARWGESGIQTFLVSHDGKVFQRNLGPETARIAAGIRVYDPGPGWQPVAP
jgi:hypothetical protein